MNILHFSSAITWRGGEQQIAYLFEELALLEIKQWVFCVKNGALAQYCKTKNIPHITYTKRFSVNPAVSWQLKKTVARLKIDLVHIHDSHSHTFSYISTYLRNKVPFVLSRRVDFPVQKTYWSRKKYNHSSIKKIISVSKHVQQVLAPAISDKSKLQVIHSGIDTERFAFDKSQTLRKQYNLPKSVKIIANIAAIAPHKDYFTFVDTATLLTQSENKLKFFVIGADGGEEAAIKNYVLQKGLKKHFIFTGFLKNIPALLPDIDLLLITSKEEGLGTSILDALACGVPVVATTAGGIPEIINHEKNGLLAPVKDAAALAQSVKRLLNDKTLRNQLSKAGKVTASKFSKTIMASKTYAAYSTILLGQI